MPNCSTSIPPTTGADVLQAALAFAGGFIGTVAVVFCVALILAYLKD